MHNIWNYHGTTTIIENVIISNVILRNYNFLLKVAKIILARESIFPFLENINIRNIPILITW